MLELLKVLKISVSSLADVFMDPIFLVVILVVYFQHRKLERMEISLFGKAVTSIREKTAYALFFGVMGGFLGTMIMSVLGITISINDFSFILPLAIFLMMIRSRYICFSYAGGIISLFSLLTGWPDINVSSIMAVVAVLHMIESLLIYIDGHSHATPILTRTKNNRVAGGFYLQKFWPIPLIVIVAILGRTGPVDTGTLPSWWPAFLAEGQSLETVMLQLTGLVAILGYGDMTLTRMPKEKTKMAAGRLALYSLGLLALSLLSTRIYVFKFAAALFAPLAHEGLILYSRREEEERPPLFEAGDVGMMVLAVKKGKPADAMGLKPGDRILRINNRLITEKSDLTAILAERLSFIWIEVRNREGQSETYEYSNYEKGVFDLGCLYVERHPLKVYVFGDKENSRFDMLLKRLKRLGKK